jgi:arylsulfatase A-like enzyme
VVGAPTDSAQAKKPNIVVIMTDDVDRIANEGALFTDYYAQQSCTAGRAAFITGQHPFRTGLLTVGLPGATLGLQKVASPPPLLTRTQSTGSAFISIGSV